MKCNRVSTMRRHPVTDVCWRKPVVSLLVWSQFLFKAHQADVQLDKANIQQVRVAFHMLADKATKRSVNMARRRRLFKANVFPRLPVITAKGGTLRRRRSTIWPLQCNNSIALVLVAREEPASGVPLLLLLIMMSMMVRMKMMRVNSTDSDSRKAQRRVPRLE